MKNSRIEAQTTQHGPISYTTYTVICDLLRIKMRFNGNKEAIEYAEYLDKVIASDYK